MASIYVNGDQVGACTFIRDDGYTNNGPNKRKAAIFLCVCGKEFKTAIAYVKEYKTSTCGCKILFPKKLKSDCYRNGKIRPEYNSWSSMKQRCSNKNDINYHNYGGRGIVVCERWHSFENFLIDMGERPSKYHSLDRFPDKNGNYEPSNCRWATPKQQMRNVRYNRMLTYEGKTLCIAEWAEILGIGQETIRSRLKMGLPTNQVLYPKKFPIMPGAGGRRASSLSFLT